MTAVPAHVSEAARTLAAARQTAEPEEWTGPDLLDVLEELDGACKALASVAETPLTRPRQRGRSPLSTVPPLPPVSPERAVDGETYDVGEDYVRLNRQQQRVYDVLTRPDAHPWWTLRALADAVGASEASVSARLRDLRKPKHGGHTVERKRLEGGLYAYRLLVNAERVSA